MTLETNRWYHVAGTYDGNTMKMYLDGVLQVSGDMGPIQVGNSSPLYFSYNDVSEYSYYLGGSLDEVAIFSRALTAPEIQRHYQYGLNSPVGGIAELPDVAGGRLDNDGTSSGGMGGATYAVLAGAAAGVLAFAVLATLSIRRWKAG